MHFPYGFLAKSKWLENLTKGTAVGGLSTPNTWPNYGNPIKRPDLEISQFFFRRRIEQNSYFWLHCPSRLLAQKVISNSKKGSCFHQGCQLRAGAVRSLSFQDPGSTKKEKDAKKDSKKKTPLSAEEQKEFAQLQNEIEVYKAKLRSEFGYSASAASDGFFKFAAMFLLELHTPFGMILGLLCGLTYGLIVE